MINVRDFGARGNETHDDTAAIQAALNAGGHVHFPSGRYLISAPLTLTSDVTEASGARS